MSRYALRYLFVVALLLVAAAPVYWYGMEFHPGGIAAAYENADLYQEIYPAFHYGFGRLWAGDLPLWNPKQLCGTPFLANPSTALFQPLNAVFLFLDTGDALAVHAFVCLSAMGFFFVLFARSLGIGYIPALIGGVLYAFCGASAAAISYPAMANALVWAPLLFWGIQEYGNGYRFGQAVAAGLAAGGLLLSGDGTLAAAFLGTGFLYALLVTVFPYGSRAPGFRPRVEGLALMAAVALSVSAIQWVPTLVWALTLDRPFETLFRFDLPGQFPASIGDLLAQLLVPKPGALPRVGYIGAGAILAIPAAFFHRRLWRDTLFFLVIAPAALMLSCGGEIRSPFSLFSPPLLFPGIFGITVLAAIGYDRLLAFPRRGSGVRLWAPALAVLTFAVLLFYVATVEPRGRIVVFVLLLLPAVVFRVRWLSASCGALFAVLLFADLSAASTNLYQHPFENAPACYERYPAAIAAAQEQALGARVAVSAPTLDFGLPANVGMLFPVFYAADGQWPLTKDQTLWWRRLGMPEGAPPEKGRRGPEVAPEAETPRLLNAMAVRVVLASPESAFYAGAWPGEGPKLREMRTQGGGRNPAVDEARVFINEDAALRVCWAPLWRVAEGVAAAADVLGDVAFDTTRECVVDRDSEGYTHLVECVGPPQTSTMSTPPTQAGGVTPPATAPDATCSVEDPSAERVVVRVTAPAPGVTVLADTFDQGWRATLDGAPCPILRANGIFRGIATPAGSHEIVFEYHPYSFFAGMAVSLAALGICTLWGLAVVIRG